MRPAVTGSIPASGWTASVLAPPWPSSNRRPPGRGTPPRCVPAEHAGTVTPAGRGGRRVCRARLGPCATCVTIIRPAGFHFARCRSPFGRRRRLARARCVAEAQRRASFCTGSWRRPRTANAVATSTPTPDTPPCAGRGLARRSLPRGCDRHGGTLPPFQYQGPFIPQLVRTRAGSARHCHLGFPDLQQELQSLYCGFGEREAGFRGSEVQGSRFRVQRFIGSAVDVI